MSLLSSKEMESHCALIKDQLDSVCVAYKEIRGDTKGMNKDEYIKAVLIANNVGLIDTILGNILLISKV